jgi:hypothetical protein
MPRRRKSWLRRHWAKLHLGGIATVWGGFEFFAPKAAAVFHMAVVHHFWWVMHHVFHVSLHVDKAMPK